jgi:hypothetical protein
MTVYVDPLCGWGWRLRGHLVDSCHMFSDQVDLAELHDLARRIGMRRRWFQDGSTPHYDLTPSRRAQAVARGAVEVEHRQAVAIWKARREKLGEQQCKS